MKNLICLTLLSFATTIFAVDPSQYIYCPSSIVCDTTTCKPKSGQDVWDNNTTLPPGTKPGEYKFIHAEWYQGAPNKSLCNYYDGTEYGIYIKAKAQLWPQTNAENTVWWPTIDSFGYCYPNDLGNSQRCAFALVPPWEPPGFLKKK